VPLETATYITDLVPSDPAHSDGLNNADAHLRLIKGTLKATFPNFTDVALQSTQTQIDAAATAVANGVPVLADAGAFFKTNSTDGVQNPAAGELQLTLQGTSAATFTRASSLNTFAFNGAVSSTGFTGPGATPVGGMIMWLTDTLPTSNGTWCWANGGTLSRTTAGAGLELYQAWSANGGNPLMYGSGNGATTFNVINMQDVVPVGKDTMGGAGSPGLLTSIATGIKQLLGALFGADTHTLTATEIPEITATGSASVSGPISPSSGGNFIVTSGNIISDSQSPTAGSDFDFVSTAPITISGVNASLGGSASVASNNTGGAAHTITQPSRVVNFIIRIA